MIYQIFDFHKAVTTSGNGNVLSVHPTAKSLLVEISGTSTARTIQFKAINLNGDLVSINGYNMTTSALATQTTGTSPEIWSFDVDGFDKVCMVVSAVSGGNVNVVGRVVA